MAMNAIDIAGLSAEQRLQLLEQIWDSLVISPGSIPVTPAQHQELDRRLDDLDRDGPVGIPWNDVLTKIRLQSR